MNTDLYNDSKIKIFVGYHKPNVIFSTDVYQPILTANVPWDNQDKVIRDNTGINIAKKNKNYGELTGQYWVWKNFLRKTKAEYIGFCHYRRFLDFDFNKTDILPFQPIMANDFNNIFEQYTQENILAAIGDYDIVLPYKLPVAPSVYAQYLNYHPKKDMDIALNTLAQLYPTYIEDAQSFMESYDFYTCLHFVMKKELFEQYMEWLFNILFAAEKRSSWNRYTKYMQVRTPAFIAERIFNIWINHKIKEKNLKVLNTTSFIIVGDGYGSTEYDEPTVAMLRYKGLVQLYTCRKLQEKLQTIM